MAESTPLPDTSTRRRPRRAVVTQARIEQALRAAQKTGAGTVRVQPDGTISIDVQPAAGGDPQQNEIAQDVEFAL